MHPSICPSATFKLLSLREAWFHFVFVFLSNLTSLTVDKAPKFTDLQFLWAFWNKHSYRICKLRKHLAIFPTMVHGNFLYPAWWMSGIHSTPYCWQKSVISHASYAVCSTYQWPGLYILQCSCRQRRKLHYNHLLPRILWKIRLQTAV